MQVRVGDVIEVSLGSFEPPQVGDPHRPGSLLQLADDPILNDVRMQELITPSAREVPGRWLIKDDQRVICSREENGAARRVLCGLVVVDSEWKSTPSFPIFWHNVLSYVSGGRPRGRWQPGPEALLDREQSWIPNETVTPPSTLDTTAGSRKLRWDEALLALAAVLMLAAWWFERRTE